MRPIALYLPQYHPIPENDRWWGKGFTEWTNVSKSKPKFSGHYQPHLPSDLGFYDLRLLETMEDQAILAKSHGIHGFCYYHYWFNGKLLLERPLEQMLAEGKPDMPFCLCWANENWTRRWDGRDQNILIEQHYSLDDDLAHIRYLIPYFKDDRYIKINGKPVFLMYRSELHPNILQTAKLWREEVEKEGLEGLYLIRVENFVSNIDPHEHGFDAGLEFAPDFRCRGAKYFKKKMADYLFAKLFHNLKVLRSGIAENNIYSYDELVDNMRLKEIPDYKYFRSVCPSWDNSARRHTQATVFHGSTPERFKQWVNEIARETAAHFKGDEQLFFINAWNEWGEGCHLEPDQRYGRAYLEAFKEGLNMPYL